MTRPVSTLGYVHVLLIEQASNKTEQKEISSMMAAKTFPDLLERGIWAKGQCLPTNTCLRTAQPEGAASLADYKPREENRPAMSFSSDMFLTNEECGTLPITTRVACCTQLFITKARHRKSHLQHKPSKSAGAFFDP
jgi:hypothetical protein